MVDFDPNATALTIVDLDPTGSGEGVPIKDFCKFLFGVMRSVGTGTITTFEIVCGTDADLTGIQIVKTHALGSAANLVGDTVWLETDVEAIREVLATATHVGVRVFLATSTDEAVVYYEAAEPRWSRADLTADYIS